MDQCKSGIEYFTLEEESASLPSPFISPKQAAIKTMEKKLTPTAEAFFKLQAPATDSPKKTNGKKKKIIR